MKYGSVFCDGNSYCDMVACQSMLMQVATGVFMNLLCVGIVTLALNTIGVPIFKLNSFPGNQTRCDNGTVNSTRFM